MQLLGSLFVDVAACHYLMFCILLFTYMPFCSQERQIFLIRELLSDRDKMSALPEEERRRELELCIAV